MHPCERIYQLGANKLTYGDTPGICRITGKQSTGLPFAKWVRDTFTDHASLLPGTIISNEALFCFDESSVLVQQLIGRDKPQRFRTYTHVVADGKWFIMTKADKERIVGILVAGTDEIICLSDSGQKHLLFKHRPGMWQLEEMQIAPDVKTFCFLHERFMKLLSIGFTQGEIISGNYLSYRVMNAGLPVWKALEDEIKSYRNSQIFNFTTWLMYTKK